MIGRPPQPPILRFNVKVGESMNGCWLWTGTLINGRYGQFWDGQRQVYAHRWAYEHFVGSIPDGLQLDHLCRTPACVNPAHLEPVTPQINTLRGDSVAATNARKTHCLRGHPLSGKNLMHVPGGRKCRTCVTAADRRYRAEKKAAA